MQVGLKAKMGPRRDSGLNNGALSTAATGETAAGLEAAGSSTAAAAATAATAAAKLPTPTKKNWRKLAIGLPLQKHAKLSRLC